MKNRLIVTILLLTLTAAYCFFFPKPKYESPEILSKLNIPMKMHTWYGKDVSNTLDLKDQLYGFVSEVFARVYMSTYSRETLLFLLLDAGNFHNPQVCLGGSGYKMKNLGQREFNVLNRKIKANVLHGESETKDLLIVYWMCIDKKQVNWTQQKIKEFWLSLFNKERIGLMVRLDVPLKNNDIKKGLALTQEFLTDISKEIPSDQAEYIFGN